MANDYIDNGTLLTKQFTPEVLKAYFSQILNLYQKGEHYPVDLEDVWRLIYSGKNKAVRALKRDFIEYEDYVTVTIPGQGGQFPTTVYKLTTACFEYFIARKVREVFEVYRKVFKKVATGEVKTVPVHPKSNAEMLLLYAQQMVEAEQRLDAMEDKQAVLEEKISEIEVRTQTDLKYSTIIGFASRYGIKVPLEKAATLGRVAINLCRQYLLESGRVPDPRFGTVRTYPDSVLYETFEKYYPNIRFR